MAKQIRSTIVPIAESIKTQLVDWLDLPPERVVWWQKPKIQDFQETKTIFLRLRRMADRAEFWSGAGRHDARVVRLLDVAPRTRYETSTTDDERWMFDDDMGYFAFEAQVLDALVSFQPVDSAGNTLAAQPLSLISASDAAKYPDAPGWADATLTFQIVHNLDLGSLSTFQ